jgi:hypothetical protein
VPALVGLALFAYPGLAMAGFPLDGELGSGGGLWEKLRNRSRSSLPALRRFPALELVSRERVIGPLREFFSVVPDGARVLMEVHPDDRSLGGLRTLLTLSEEVLPTRDVELLPDEYVRIDAPRHFLLHAAFNEAAADSHLLGFPRRLGASHVLAFTPAFVARLLALGFVEVAVLPSGPGDRAALPTLASDRNRTLKLLRHPIPGERIEPETTLSVRANVIEWMARSGSRYVLRYAARPQIRAFQGSQELIVDAVPAAEGTDLQFIAVTAAVDGPLRIRYSEGWL